MKTASIEFNKKGLLNTNIVDDKNILIKTTKKVLNSTTVDEENTLDISIVDDEKVLSSNTVDEKNTTTVEEEIKVIMIII